MRITRLLPLTCVVAFGLVSGAGAQIKDQCSIASLHGSFGLRAPGHTTTGGCLDCPRKIHV
jgi:hypothetical protein